MINSLLRRFLGEDHEGAASADVLDTISAALERLDPRHARIVAAFAYLLSRVAHADHEVTPDETAAMERIVREVGGLPAEEASLVVQLATMQHVQHRGTEDYLVAREFNDVATADEKRRLMSCLFAVSASDEQIVTVEDNEIRQIAGVLRIEHDELVRLRSAHRRHLAVLRRQAPGPD
ncbi:MAG: TerB family tellurite resistance protein [Vicinamibacteraceae bacterium]